MGARSFRRAWGQEKNICFLFFVFVFWVRCSLPGEVIFQQALGEELPLPSITPRTGLPGTGLEGGPAQALFWLRDRRQEASPSLDGFYQIEAQKLALSEHFVLYRDSSYATLMPASEAQQFLDFFEVHLPKLKRVYGDNYFPEIHPYQRIVILATDIRDDYTKTGQFIAGFFSPRDLFSDEFTRGLYLSPLLISRYEPPTVQLLRGRSNENALVYIDLNPTYNGVAFDNQSALARNYLKDVVLHELSHLFTWYRRVTRERLKIHDLWIAEGMAENAPHLVANTTSAFQERLTLHASPLIQAELQKAPSLLEFKEGGTGYVQSLIFFSYLRHRLGPSAEIGFRQLVIVENPDLMGLWPLVNQVNGGSFSDLYRDYVISSYLSQAGKNLTTLIREDGSAINLGDGGPGSRKYELSYRGIGLMPAGEGGLSFLPSSLAVSYEAPSCIKGFSYFTFRYTHNGPSDSCPGAQPKFLDSPYNPTNRGTHPALGFIINTYSEIPYHGDAKLHLFRASQNIPPDLFDPCQVYHIIVYNATTDSNCLPVGNLPVDERNHSSWVGGGQDGWQTDQGAPWGNEAGFFYRPAGIAFYRDGTTGFLYVADYINMAVSRYRAADGAFQGRLGELTLDCTFDSELLDGYHWGPGRFVNNHCRRSFFEPRGLATDSAGNLYVADSGNMRVVKYDKDGRFIAWLGLPKSINDHWQCEPFSPAASSCRATVGTGTQPPMSRDELYLLSNYEYDVTMFYIPWGIYVDEANNALYVVNYGGRRLVRRNLTTGAFEAYIGNGRPTSCNGWENSSAGQSPHAGSTSCFFREPTGIGGDSQYLYVADSGNHRIVRIKKTGYDATHFQWLGGDFQGWGNHPTPAGVQRNRFSSPQDVTSDGTYLYIADRRNQRIVRRKISTGESHWLGGGHLAWQNEDHSPPVDPLKGGMHYLPTWYLEPQAVLFVPTSQSLASKRYLYMTATYNGRLSRINLNCADDLISGDCSYGY